MRGDYYVIVNKNKRKGGNRISKEVIGIRVKTCPLLEGSRSFQVLKQE